MTDRVQMLEATLDLIDEGVAILDEQSTVLFWNKAAAALTGRPPEEVCARRCPEDLYQIDAEHQVKVGAKSIALKRDAHCRMEEEAEGVWPVCLDHLNTSSIYGENRDDRDELQPGPILVLMGHKLGHTVPGMLRKATLRDSRGDRSGSALLFYPVEEVDQLPHGEAGESADIERSQAEMEDRLDAAHHQWRSSAVPFGLLWMSVDQAQSLRKTHGRDACESMLRTVEQTLLRQMKPAEVIGRWGDHEFLVLADERTAELLLEHSRRLVGLARTADFRWWGDRVGLTMSVGVAQATEGDTLQTLLQRARQAMHTSEYAGGNRVTEARKN